MIICHLVSYWSFASFDRHGDDLLRRVGQVIRRRSASTPLSREDFAAFLDFVPSRRTTSGTLKPTCFAGVDDGAGDRVALHDAAEDVDEHGLDVRDRRG